MSIDFGMTNSLQCVPMNLDPIQTALGRCWPRPRTRKVLQELETCQKKIGECKMRVNGVYQLPKEARADRLRILTAELQGYEDEMEAIMDALKKYPATSEQFKDPTKLISVCCKEYIASANDDKTGEPAEVCRGCNRVTTSYLRSEKEDWTAEEKEIADEAMEEAKEQMEQAKENKDKLPDIEPGEHYLI